MIASDAYRFLIPLGLVTAAAWLLGGLWWALGPLALALFVTFFFRDPEREIPSDPAAIVSPADGRVIRVQTAEDGATRIVVFLSIFDVHINRAPVGGRVQRQDYRSGRFHFAWDDRASVDNEQVRMSIGDERKISFVLIAGLVARRIVLWTRAGQDVQKGDRIGLIRFGSRVDMWLPADCEVLVERGDRVRGGSSILGRWRDV